MAETLCNSGAVVLKAGKNAAVLTIAQYTQLINQAECFINVNSKKDWVAAFASLPTDTKNLLQDACSSFAALSVINYDMSGFTSRTEAQVMLDVNWNRTVEIINLLKEDKFKDFTTTGALT